MNPTVTEQIITGREALYSSKPLNDDTWVYSPDRMLRARVTYAGEGIDGEYVESDPTDVALMRIDIIVRADSWTADPEEPYGGGWNWPQGGGSVCTHIRRDHVTSRQRGLLGASAAHHASLAFERVQSISDVLDMISRWNETSADEYHDLRMR